MPSSRPRRRWAAWRGRPAPYSPWQKGKVECLNRTIEQQLLQGLPGWTGGPRDAAGGCTTEAVMTLQKFVALFAGWVADYNLRRPHTALGGQTPAAIWASDPTPVRTISHEDARWMLLARTPHVVAKDGIHHRRKLFFAPELNGLAGEPVEVAHMPHV